MALSNFNKRHIGSILVVILLIVVAGALTGCEYLDEWSPSPPPEQEKPEAEVPSPNIKVKIEETAILAVYEHLLSQAEGYEAKSYLADFYATCDNWTAESELFRDGTSIWHVVVDMTDVEVWEERPYWQQAGWFILQDGKVLPSNRFQANALRIEADLQELSPPPSVEE